MKTARISYPTPPGKRKKNWYGSGIDVEPIKVTHMSFANPKNIKKEIVLK